MNNYQNIIMEKIAAGEIPSNSSGIIRIDCKHDPWCGINKGGECNCNVEVSIDKDPKTPRHTEQCLRFGRGSV